MASQVLEEMVIKISAETGNLTAEMASWALDETLLCIIGLVGKSTENALTP